MTKRISRRAFLPVLGLVPVWRAWDSSAVPNPIETRLLAGGDVMLGRWIGKAALESEDPAWPLRGLAPALASADLAFVNLESPFSDKGPVYPGNMIFRAAPEMIAALKESGIDVVSTANNHARDCGARGVEYTLDWLAKNGIAAAGSGSSEEAAHEGVVLERNGFKFGFLAYTYDQSNGNWSEPDPRIAVLDLEVLREDIARLRGRAQVVIVSMHAGIEYQMKPHLSQVTFARAAIDAGAQVVLGHHPHVVQPWERYKNGVIYYSLGNLVFDQFQRRETQRGLLAEIVFHGRSIKRAGVLPVELRRGAPQVSQA
jgi:poly-gamma-glutamate synthesis protein (capsule biosynthesis protein)